MKNLTQEQLDKIDQIVEEVERLLLDNPDSTLSHAYRYKLVELAACMHNNYREQEGVEARIDRVMGLVLDSYL
ncbi:MAG: hypothetical protein AB1384_12340 [Actinomycetota bacterium]